MQDNVKVKLTEKGAKYAGRTGTDNNTAKQWEGFSALLPKEGSTATVAQLRKSYEEHYGVPFGFVGNLKYHIRSQRLAVIK